MTKYEPGWHKSTYSAQSGSCVEVAEGPEVLVRDTQYRSLGHLAYSAQAWAAFLHDVRLGHHD